jgi:hypothetical protein
VRYRRHYPRRVAIEKIIDRETKIKCCHGPAKIREEVWQDPSGKVVRYNLAFIHHFIYPRDNGRVLGYDTAHGHHHRHFMGSMEEFEFTNYGALADKFFREVEEICRNSKKEN